ncbi:MAG TPA: HisA/HisF-related TIM barrel protein, partial [bacterium]|nr:HisA/HisF-related TIM barrel protein [bacterium]
EILLTSMDRDGTKGGYDIPLTELISRNVSIPVIASGGAGREKDFSDVFIKTDCTAALAASLFHYRILEISKLKKYLKKQKIAVREV